jgi:hypothetical protein
VAALEAAVARTLVARILVEPISLVVANLVPILARVSSSKVDEDLVVAIASKEEPEEETVAASSR